MEYSNDTSPLMGCDWIDQAIEHTNLSDVVQFSSLNFDTEFDKVESNDIPVSFILPGKLEALDYSDSLPIYQSNTSSLSLGKLEVLGDPHSLPNYQSNTSSLSPGKLGALDDPHNLPNYQSNTSMLFPGKLGALEDPYNLPNYQSNTSSLSPGKLGALDESHSRPNSIAFNRSRVSVEEMEGILEEYDAVNYGTTKAGGSKEGVQPLATSAKTGSQAFDVIDAAAVLELDGIPAPSQPFFDDDTYLVKLIDDTNMLPDPLCGTLAADLKLIGMPGEINGIQTCLRTCDTPLTDLKPDIVPDRPTSTIIPNGNILLDLKPAITADKAITTIPTSCGTLSTDLQAVTEPHKPTSGETIEYKPCGTALAYLKPVTVSHQGTTAIPSPCSSPLATSKPPTKSPKRSRQRKRQKNGGVNAEARKVKLYELDPLDDTKKERQRKDAQRAKRCRDRQRMEMENLRRKLMEVQQEKDSLAQELMGRRSYEEALLRVLKEKHGITVTAFGALRNQIVPPLPPSSKSSE